MKVIIFIVLTIIIIVIYFVYLFLFLADAPVGIDDVYAINLFLNSFYQSSSMGEKFNLLFSNYREHVIIVTKIAALLFWKLYGKFNFIYYTLIGNLCFVGIAMLLLINSYKKLSISITYFIPVILFIFHAQYTQTAIWPMAVWSNGWVLLLAFSSLNFLNKVKNNTSYMKFVAALFGATLTTFSNGNGIVVFFAGAYLLWVNKLNYKYSLLWIITFTLCLYAILSITSITGSSPQELSYSILLNPLAFLGSYFAVFKHPNLQPVLTTTAGGIIVCYIIAIYYNSLLRGQEQQNNFLVACLTFILLTAIGVGLQRAEEKGLIGMYIGRYRHYSSIALCICYLLVVHQKVNRKKIFYFALIISTPLWLLSYYIEYGYTKTHLNRTWSTYFNGMINGRFLTEGLEEDKVTAEILKVSEQTEIYTMDDSKILFNNYDTNQTARKEKVPLSIKFTKDARKSSTSCSDYAFLDFPTIQKSSYPDTNEYVVLMDNARKYFIESSAKKASLHLFMSSGQYFSLGLQAQIPLCLYSNASYKIEIWKISDDNKIVRYDAGVVNFKEQLVH